MRIRIGTRGAAALMATSLVLAAACGSSASTGGSGSSAAGPVRATQNASLGTTVLVNRRGLTLYSLSAERNGRFICTNMSCLKLWHPLVAPSGGVQGDPVSALGTIQRPGGGPMQVTYRGLPLYTFAGGHKSGSVAGNGFKDVGTWQAATTSKSAVAAPPSTSSGGGYGY